MSKCGEWISVGEYAEIMNISRQRVHQRISEGSLKSLPLEEFAKQYPEDYRKFGRGPKQSASIVVWLDDDDCG